MDPTADLGTPFPLPPSFYKKYDQKTMEKLKPQLKYLQPDFFTTIREKVEIKDSEESSIAPAIKKLLPPAIPENCTEYITFGRLFKLNEKFPPFEELKIKLFYTSQEDPDLLKEVRGLNRSALFQYQELLVNLVNQAASTEPETELQQRIEKFHLTFVNMMHMINRLRPVQARETLSLVVQKRTEYFRDLAKSMDKKCEDTNIKIQEHMEKFKRKSSNEIDNIKIAKNDASQSNLQQLQGLIPRKHLDDDPYLQELIKAIPQ